MGSFYATCSISGMSLTHQKMYGILLVPSAYSIENNIEKWQRAVNWDKLTNKDTNKNSDFLLKNPKPLESVDRVSYDNRETYFKQKGLLVSNDGALAVFAPFGFPIKGNYDDYGQMENIERDDNVLMLEDFFGLSIEEILKYACVGGTVLPNSKNLDVLKQLSFTYIRSDVYDFLVQDAKSNIDWYEEYRKENLAQVKEFFEKKSNSRKKENQTLEEKWELVYGINRSIIPSLCAFNFLKMLPLESTDFEKYVDLYYFVVGMNRIYKMLMPSNYGSQESNLKALVRLNEKVVEISKEDLKYFEEE